MVRRTTLAALLVALLLVTAGCSTASDTDAPSGGDVGESTAADGGSAGTHQGTEAGGGTSSGEDGGDAAIDRKLVRTASLTMRVESFEAARANLTDAVRSNGGYVGDAMMRTQEYDNETYTQGTIVLRVPVENYSTFLTTVEGEGLVLESNQNVDDVTREYVDLEARLENLQRQRDRLRDLYDQANTTEEVLAVEARLSDVQGEIERTEARLRTLQNQVALATITVHLREERPEGEPIDRTRWYETGVVDAFLESVGGVVVTLRAVVVALAYAAPYLLVFGLPILALVAALRRRHRFSLPSIRNRGGSE